MIEVTVFEEHRPNEDGADRRNARHASQLLECKIHVLQRQDRSSEQTVGCCFAKVDDPVDSGSRYFSHNAGGSTTWLSLSNTMKSLVTMTVSWMINRDASPALPPAAGRLPRLRLAI
jgi:hypothetical protein